MATPAFVGIYESEQAFSTTLTISLPSGSTAGMPFGLKIYCIDGGATATPDGSFVTSGFSVQHDADGTNNFWFWRTILTSGDITAGGFTVTLDTSFINRIQAATYDSGTWTDISKNPLFGGVITAWVGTTVTSTSSEALLIAGVIVQGGPVGLASGMTDRTVTTAFTDCSWQDQAVGTGATGSRTGILDPQFTAWTAMALLEPGGPPPADPLPPVRPKNVPDVGGGLAARPARRGFNMALLPVAPQAFVPRRRVSAREEPAQGTAPRRRTSLAALLPSTTVSAPPPRARRVSVDQPRSEQLPQRPRALVPATPDNPVFMLWCGYDGETRIEQLPQRRPAMVIPTSAPVQPSVSVDPLAETWTGQSVRGLRAGVVNALAETWAGQTVRAGRGGAVAPLVETWAGLSITGRRAGLIGVLAETWTGQTVRAGRGYVVAKLTETTDGQAVRGHRTGFIGVLVESWTGGTVTGTASGNSFVQVAPLVELWAGQAVRGARNGVTAPRTLTETGQTVRAGRGYRATTLAETWTGQNVTYTVSGGASVQVAPLVEQTTGQAVRAGRGYRISPRALVLTLNNVSTYASGPTTVFVSPLQEVWEGHTVGSGGVRVSVQPMRQRWRGHRVRGYYVKKPMPNCTCAEAPQLSGGYTQNVTLTLGETERVIVPWAIPQGQEIFDEYTTWTVFPATEPPLVVENEESANRCNTRGIISGGVSSQMYKVTNTVTMGGEGTDDTVLQSSVWVWIPASDVPAVHVPCDG